MTADATLARLALRAGIEPWFHDIWGQRYDVTAATQRGLLGAMGLPAADEDSAQASLRRLEEAPWRRLLPPVVVLSEYEPLAVPVTLPVGAGAVSWTLEAESGAVRTGEAATESLPLLEERTLDGQRLQRRQLAVGGGMAPGWGYHRLTVDAGATRETLSLVIAPERALLPEEVNPAARHTWGLAAQLYGVRSAGDWGVGDFGDLARLGRLAAGWGASTLGLPPLHALFPADANHWSPYSPSHRGFVNVLYIDVIAVPDLAVCMEAQAMIGAPDFQRRLQVARGADLVDYPAVAALKLPVLECLYRSFRTCHLDRSAPTPTPRARAFRAFQEAMGEELHRLTLFDALHEFFYGSDPFRWDWRSWPEPFQSPDSPQVKAFAAEHAHRLDFYAWLQWLAETQLADAAAESRAAGLALGFYRDLAVATHPGGAAAWSEPAAIAATARVGAPPDHFNLHGQDWGLAPFSPVALQELAYRPFIALLRANMRHAGVVRIDHVMALQHLYWIPPEGGIGAYVSYPFADLRRLVALESHRNRCVVVGEDLGTVPDGFRPEMQRAGILSYRVFWFERDGSGHFLPPEAHPENALVTVTTHDLATLRGFWEGRDLVWRRQLGLYPTTEMADGDHHGRESDRWRLLEALERAGVRPDSLAPRHGLPPWSPEMVLALIRYLGRSPSRLLMVPLEDVVGEAEQPNLPGTVTEHPNWRRRLEPTLEQIARSPLAARIAAALRECGRAMR